MCPQGKILEEAQFEFLKKWLGARKWKRTFTPISQAIKKSAGDNLGASRWPAKHMPGMAAFESALHAAADMVASQTRATAGIPEQHNDKNGASRVNLH